MFEVSILGLGCRYALQKAGLDSEAARLRRAIEKK